MSCCKKLRIRGKVQGVYFRESLKNEAHKSGISGWVRNRGDGSVEALLQGEEASVDQLVEWCRHGPPQARVDSVDVSTANPESVTGFERRPTE